MEQIKNKHIQIKSGSWQAKVHIPPKINKKKICWMEQIKNIYLDKSCFPASQTLHSPFKNQMIGNGFVHEASKTCQKIKVHPPPLPLFGIKISIIR